MRRGLGTPQALPPFVLFHLPRLPSERNAMSGPPPAGLGEPSSSSSSLAAAPVISKHQIDVSQLPSVRDGSMSAQEEAIKRRKTCRFIEEVGRALKLPRVAIATAMVFFHRFYAKHSFNEQYVAGWWLFCNVRDGGEGSACLFVHARCRR